MKNKKIMVLGILGSFVCAQVSFAGTCTLHVTRTACPGQQTDSYAKCNGAASCDEISQTSSAESCGNAAKKACLNTRLKVTQSKVITADFDKAPVEGGKDLCDPKSADFNQC